MNKYIKILNIILAIATSVIIHSCKSGGDVDEKESSFCISDTMMTNIQIDTAQMEVVQNELKLNGKVTFNEDRVVRVFPLVGGVVMSLKVELGDYVQKGQELAYMRSSEMADFENQLNISKSNLSIAQKNLSALEDMYKSGLASEKDIINTRSELQKAKGEVTRINEVLSIYRVGDSLGYTIKAPISGYIVDKNINPGMQIRGDFNTPVFTISELNQVWIMANVYESDIAKIQKGYPVEVTTLSYPDRIFTGTIDRINQVLDPESKVMQVRIKIYNDDYALKPEMFASVIVRYAEANQLVAVPSRAVIFDKSRNYVMIYHDKCNIETRAIDIYKSQTEKTYINSGIKDGERLISKNQLLIYDALND